jgi:hypothetical protein
MLFGKLEQERKEYNAYKEKEAIELEVLIDLSLPFPSTYYVMRIETGKGTSVGDYEGN